jgi:isopenicillin-N epimerase
MDFGGISEEIGIALANRHTCGVTRAAGTMRPGRHADIGASDSGGFRDSRSGIVTTTAAMPLSGYGAGLRGEWPLDPAVTYLNHGSYGLTPRAVLAVQAEWRERMERNPMRFMAHDLPGAQRAAATELAAYLGARGEDVVFVDNATTGCNAVLRSLTLAAGDEILLTNLGYGAVAKAARYAAERGGATVVEAAVPRPLPAMADALAVVAARLGPRTRLAIFDHIASQSGLVLPVAELTRMAHAVGARVLVDGAHAPGQVPLDLPAIGADWYVGNCHKWLMAPRGCGFLWAAPAAQALTHPLTISHGYRKGFIAEFDWTGTRDPTPCLSVPAGIAFHRRLGGTALMTRNAALAAEAARLLAERWGTAAIGPATNFAAMAAVRLPPSVGTAAEQGAALQRRLSAEHRIEAAISAEAGALWLRVAAQAYNELTEYERLAGLI